MTNFKAGDKVVCVDDSAPQSGFLVHEDTINKKLLKGSIYLVTVVADRPRDGKTCLTLAPDSGAGRGWLASRFRKLITRTERERMEVEARL